MLAPSEELERRRPVWEALADLFLDTELDESTYRYIARSIVESGYTDDEAHCILFREVFPACGHNLFDVAGVWAGFDGDWLQERILANAGAVQPTGPLLSQGHSYIEAEWRKVLQLMEEARAGPMTENTWLTQSWAYSMFNHVVRTGKATPRKLRLFAVACCRRIWPLLEDERSRDALLLAERLADGAATTEEAQNAARLAGFVVGELGQRGAILYHAARAAGATLSLDNPANFFWTVSTQVVNAIKPQRNKDGFAEEDRREDADLIRDIVGNPFRAMPAIDVAWLSWNGGMVSKLAQAIYDDRAFDRLPILADALEDAGCTSADILSHCRQPGEHCRGCWVLDLLLGKE